jgi:hypothetical protein
MSHEQKTRYRIQTRFFRKPLVVLQVAEMKPYNYDPMFDLKPGGFAPVWRDAHPEDLMNGEQP